METQTAKREWTIELRNTRLYVIPIEAATWEDMMEKLSKQLPLEKEKIDALNKLYDKQRPLKLREFRLDTGLYELERTLMTNESKIGQYVVERLDVSKYQKLLDDTRRDKGIIGQFAMEKQSVISDIHAIESQTSKLLEEIRKFGIMEKSPKT